MKSTLSSLQNRILEVLETDDLGWTLTGDAALAGFHLGHRRTDDLDLFFHGKRPFDRAPRQIEDRLVAEGLTTEALAPHDLQDELRGPGAGLRHREGVDR